MGIELVNTIEVRLKKFHIASGIKQVVVGIHDFIDQAYKEGLLKLTSDQREVVEYKKNQILYKENQRPKFLDYILGGKIKIFKRNPEGKESEYHFFQQFDEMESFALPLIFFYH